jgi:hypothetical protein
MTARLLETAAQGLRQRGHLRGREGPGGGSRFQVGRGGGEVDEKARFRDFPLTGFGQSGEGLGDGIESGGGVNSA